MNDIHSLSHSKWNCKYHIVFAPKYRRKVFYADKRQEIGELFVTLSQMVFTTDCSLASKLGSQSVPVQTKPIKKQSPGLFFLTSATFRSSILSE